jgi:hypothetical protein
VNRSDELPDGKKQAGIREVSVGILPVTRAGGAGPIPAHKSVLPGKNELDTPRGRKGSKHNLNGKPNNWAYELVPF